MALADIMPSKGSQTKEYILFESLLQSSRTDETVVEKVRTVIAWEEADDPWQGLTGKRHKGNFLV